MRRPERVTALNKVAPGRRFSEPQHVRWKAAFRQEEQCALLPALQPQRVSASKPPARGSPSRSVPELTCVSIAVVRQNIIERAAAQRAAVRFVGEFVHSDCALGHW